MKAAGARKYLGAEKVDQERLRAKAKKGEDVEVSPTDGEIATSSKSKPPQANLEGTAESLEAEPMSAEAGIEAEDTSFLYGPDSMDAGDQRKGNRAETSQRRHHWQTNSMGVGDCTCSSWQGC